MPPGAQTPEELGTLSEDAYILRDASSLGELFEPGALLVGGIGSHGATAPHKVPSMAAEGWDVLGAFSSNLRHVYRVADTALLVGRGLGVARRGADGAWRYTILVWEPQRTGRGEDKMNENDRIGSSPRVIGPDDGELLGPPAGVMDRFMILAPETEGRLALVEHRLAPRALAAPFHRHSREDELSYVLEGRVGALLGDREVVAPAGHLIVKPRGQWHTFWNAGDEPARILEIISPGGLEQLFRQMDLAGPDFDPASLPALAGQYGCDVDFDRTLHLVELHALIF